MEMSRKAYIPPRFRKAVNLHIAKNFMANLSIKVPLILGIHGPSGNGKTYQCECILNEIGTRVFLISGGQLESEEAGKPARLIRTAYLNAGDCIQSGECLTAAVVINDIDTGIGSWGDMVQYTINRQTVFGELMHLVDYPNFVEGRKTLRIPIIFTGNDFTRLYEPLVRAGRMTSFEWLPNLEDKVEIVTRIFPEITDRAHIISIVKEFEFEPIAFFSHLKSSLIDDELWDFIESDGLQIFLSKYSNHKSNRQNNFLPSVTYERIINQGRFLLDSNQLINHLQDTKNA